MGLRGLLRTIEGGDLGFWCPGCEEMHVVNVGDPLGVLRGGVGGWTFNGNYAAPSFSPSVLVTSGHYAPGRADPEHCWCTYNAAHPDDPSKFTCGRCHSFVRDGRIEFLGDSTHALAGQTVPMVVPELS